MFLEGTTQELAKIALNDKLPELQQLEGFVGISTIYSESKAEHILRVRFESATNFTDLKPMLYYHDLAGVKRRIGVEYLAAGKVMAHADIDYGLEVEAGKFQARGRCCYFFKSTEPGDDNIYGLSCAHVFGYTGESELEGPFQIAMSKNENTFSSFEASVKYATGNDAVIFPINEVSSANLNAMVPIVGITAGHDLLNEHPVLISTQNGVVSALLVDEYNKEIKVEYKDRSTRTFIGLMSVKLNQASGNGNGTNTSPTKKGDSGGLVYLENHQAVGMIVAGDDVYSYAIKLSEIEKQMKMRICPITELRQMQNHLNT